ncbi:MAG: GNAT family N-acetyltransferase [Gemmatimonadaceae bacterium]
MSHDIIVRPARADERATVRELTLRAYAEFADVMEPAAWDGLAAAVRAALDAEDADPRAECIVADRAGRLVGSVMLYPATADAYGGATARTAAPELRLLAVPPEARGLGVGRLLIEACARRARELGAQELGLHTSRSMAVARRLYAAAGFERAPERDFRPEGAELVEGYRLRLE